MAWYAYNVFICKSKVLRPYITCESCLFNLLDSQIDAFKVSVHGNPLRV